MLLRELQRPAAGQRDGQRGTAMQPVGREGRGAEQGHAPRGPERGGHERGGAEQRRQGHATAQAPRARTAVAAHEGLAVPPRRELRQHRMPDPHQLEPAAQSRQAHLAGADPHRRGAEPALALLDGLPAVVERGQVPPPAAGTDHPEATACRVEGEAPPDGAALDLVIPAQRGIAEEAAWEHAALEGWRASMVGNAWSGRKSPGTVLTALSSG
ncbi:MAG: hypothetical protein IPL76_00610 [Gemmatimonadetes bacterium]|nr:hypothetical protein [Gemmatimonadota bacterium]